MLLANCCVLIQSVLIVDVTSPNALGGVYQGAGGRWYAYAYKSVDAEVWESVIGFKGSPREEPAQAHRGRRPLLVLR